ncbi:putative membrane protein [Leptospira fainei serovar Hurstbridge str. BUT 6]|uniref:Membrane protein n=1 Tax=Leptospira fainei serovar Hurstbridge str. BUT 6 TaxID=1193011 RepID=S3V7R0_9LEPT|nr:histidine kinase N-terminal 7TM domain-containing protein [Leptospira fainei]EPG72450.1 putative membrane protein [Leptospira fainei serovar Hurstbridge str. BUT 6]
MAIVTFVLLSLSALHFYKGSEKNYLNLSFSLIALLMSVWCALLSLSEIPLPFTLQSSLINLIPIPILFIPILLIYITFNYSKPNSPTSPPAFLTLFHVIAIVFFSWYAFEGEVGPYRMEGRLRIFKPGPLYYPACTYIYVSVFLCLAILIRNIFIGNYFVRIHSIYLSAGAIFCGLISYFFIILSSSFGISAIPTIMLGTLAFLWIVWLSITNYRLFNIDLSDFKYDFRNPRFSSTLVSLNRFLLKKIDPMTFAEICNQFEAKRREEVYALQAEMLLEFVYSKEGTISNHVRQYSQKVTDLFIN